MGSSGASNWILALPDLITGAELPEAIYAENERNLVDLIRATNEPILQILAPLGAYLTTETDAPRSRAVGLLAKVVEQIPDAVRTEGDVHHLAEYFTARLCDWPAIRGALHGCLALLSREPPRATLATADAITLMAAMIDGVYVRSLSATDRAIAILVLHVAVQRHGQGLLDAGQDIMEFTIASVDGEKDPRCLMKGFAAVRAVLELYQAQPEPSLHFGRLEDSTEELFDVLSCYFPVSFTPPPNDQHGITRDGIAAELQATLVAFPAFAPLLVPLALEKLSSTVRVAKLDALNLLGAAAEAYGPEPLAQHVPAIWAGVRAELMAPTSEGLLDAQVAALEELAAAAAAALSRCIRAFAAKDGMALSALVLEDTAVEDVLRCTASPGMEPAAFRRSALRTKAGAVMLEALGNAGGAPAHNMAAKVLQPLVVSATEQEQAYMQAVVGPRTAQLCALRLTWAAILTLVRSLAVGLSKDSLDGHADGGIDATLLHSIVEAAAQLISQDDPSTRMMDGSGDEQRFEVWSTDPTASTPLNVVMVRLQTLQAVFTSTATAASVSKDVAGKVLDVLLQGVSSGIDALQEEATAVLSCMASPMGAHSALIVDSALPMLLAAATGVESSSAIQADVALAVVQQLSLASEAILRESVLAMDQAIQLSLPNALVDAMHLEALLRLLSAAMWVAQQGETRGTWSSKTVATELLMVLAQHLLEAVAMLDRSSLPEGSAPVSNRDLLTAVAGFLSITTRNGGQNVQQLGEVAIEIMANASGFEEENAIADLKAAATCGAIIGLDAEVSRTVLANQSQDFLQSQASRTIGEHAAQPFLSKALASLMNKAETDASEGPIKAALETILLACNDFYAASGPWTAIADVARALAMRGSKTLEHIVQSVLEVLRKVSSSDPSQISIDLAATFFGTLLDDPDGAALGSLALDRQSNAVTRPLWQQRTYTIAIAALIAALSPEHAGNGATAMEVDETHQLPSPFIVGLGRVLASAPHTVVRNDAVRAVPWLTRCLAELGGVVTSPSVNASLLAPLLTALIDILDSDVGKREAQGSLIRLVPAVVALTAYRPSPGVREAALRCLQALLKLPYSALHPYRREILTAVAAATDDNKRTVRATAAKCREAWLAT